MFIKPNSIHSCVLCMGTCAHEIQDPPDNGALFCAYSDRCALLRSVNLAHFGAQDVHYALNIVFS